MKLKVLRWKRDAETWSSIRLLEALSAFGEVSFDAVETQPSALTQRKRKVPSSYIRSTV